MTHSFNDLGLSEKSLDAVRRLGYEEPTPVQEQAIPLVLEGRDIIAAAKTGTGKTAAFSLPLLDTLGHIQRGQGPLMLVVTPTRELADQIGTVCTQIAEFTHHRITTVVGGLSYDPQIQQLKRGVDVLIATPGRLIDLIEREAVKLNNVEALVLDEADRMLDMGFWPQVKKIIAETPATRKTLLFSATIDKHITDSIGSILRDPAVVQIAHKGETADTVDQYRISAPQNLKAALLNAVLKEKGANRVIVFTRTRSRSDSCTRRLRRAGYSAEAIHSDRSQSQRKRALDNFSKGKTSVLVATDVLARGIDVTEVDYVINYDIPNVPEDYIHRIGRTGRAGETGFAISFISPEQEADMRAIEKLIKQEVPTLELQGFDREKAEEEAARKATKVTARKDPELAQAAQEYTKAKRRKARKENQETVKKTPKGQGQGSAAKPASQEKPRTDSKGGKAAAKPKPKQKKPSASKPGVDMRPGRAQRAALESKRSRSKRGNR